MSEDLDHIGINPKDKETTTTRIDIDDETSIEIGDIVNLDGSEIQSNEDVETKEANTHNTNLRSEKVTLENEKTSLYIKESCKGKAKNDFAIYNLRSPDQNPFQRQRSILVYFQTPRPIPTEGEPLVYDDPGSRNGFVRMVFTLVFIMVCFTISCAVGGKSIWVFNKFLNSQLGFMIFIAMMVLIFLLHYVMLCSNCSRSIPMNYICLILVTTGYSYIVAYITLRYKTIIVLGAFFGTAAIAFICMLLAMTSFDFTRFLLYVVVISLAVSAVFVAYMLAKSFFGFEMKPLHIGILLATTVLNAIMLVMELQMILGGQTVELGVDDYALGAYLIYTSIISIFLDLLRLLGLLDE